MRELRLTPAFIAKHHNLEESFNKNFVLAFAFQYFTEMGNVLSPL